MSWWRWQISPSHGSDYFIRDSSSFNLIWTLMLSKFMLGPRSHHNILSYRISTDSPAIKHVTWLCWALECVVKRFIIFAIFMDFPTISCRKPFRAVRVVCVQKSLACGEHWKRERKRGKKKSSKNNKSYNESHCLTFTCKLSWRLVLAERKRTSKLKLFYVEIGIFQL